MTAEMLPDDASRRPNDRPCNEPRRRLARELRGSGIEFGPGCFPMELGPAVREVRYCDRFTRESFERAFPELAEHVDRFPAIDFSLDLDLDDFADIIGPGSADFVVSCHVLEHLVNPLLFLERTHRLLKPDGVLFLAVPDKRQSFDRLRPRTRLSELVDRYRLKQSHLTDDMLIDYVNQTESPAILFSASSPGFSERCSRMRETSIHANVWLIDDLLEILVHVGRTLSAPFALVDGLVRPDEMILLLRKSSDVGVLDQYDGVMQRIWFDSHRQLMESENQPKFEELERLVHDVRHALLSVDERARETQGFVKQIKAMVDRLPIAGPLARWISTGKRQGPH